MTELIGLCILVCTGWLSFKYRPAIRDSFLLMGLCLFCGMIVLLSGVDSLNFMSILLSVLGGVLVVLYRGQLRAWRKSRENTREEVPEILDEREQRGEYSRFVRRSRRDYVA